MHVVEVLVYTHVLALKHINYETEIDIDNVCKMFYRSIQEGWRTQVYCFCNFSLYVTVPGKRDHFGNFFKIELLLQQERV